MEYGEIIVDMKQYSVFLSIFFALLIIMAFPCSADVTFIDDYGTELRLDRPATRVVPLYGAFLEMLIDIGAGKTVVARTEADSYIKGVEHLPVVGTHMKPNIELIIAKHPDLIIMTIDQRRRLPEISRLEEVGIKIAAFNPVDFEDIFSTMLRLGVATGHSREAQEKVQQLRNRLERLRELVKKRGKSYTAFFEVREHPLTAAGRDSIVNKILQVAGLHNIVKGPGKLIQYSVEAILAEDPNYYIIQKGPMNKNPTNPSQRPHIRELTAVKEGRVIFVDEYTFSRPSPGCVDAIASLVEQIYGVSNK